ncbi:hydroxymethylpyrimidine/phosphomethylpyrimidine kinase [Pacificibacter maritimus]|uniref:hydroxymethylpyrimidine kinase n=1 Tax=Pacificibacter maritimus TaxID=762213 RepID=A0A3N4V354_9RHOB|nr:hydroxymethylpyrimidine/phosphomethylpyrimidine kinase [Pacificibacter maritimus]RPE71517.1 hydroxymethylpyrimidine/phosphomethylpyrimidine kinase [Pacificibacter maritimus]
MTRILIIGGTDSSGGAGITCDTSVAYEFGCHVSPVVTCVTAQSNRSVQALHPLPADMIHAQIAAACEQGPPDAIKIGMVGSKDCANAIKDALAPYRTIPVILDPVLRASSGGRLTQIHALDGLIAMSALITPNLDEAAALSNQAVAQSHAALTAQGAFLRTKGAKSVLIKGGHGQGDTCCDTLFTDDAEQSYCTERFAQNKRGTGCALATAIACTLARGHSLAKACDVAKKFISEWIQR